MKKLLSLAVLGLVLLSSCVKGFDGMEPEPTPTPEPTPSSGVTDEDIKKHAEEILGVSIPADQDWKSTTNGTVTVNANSAVKKVAIMALVSQTDEDGELFNSMTVLNEAETNGQSSLSINYDAPEKNEGLYAAFYTENVCYYEKIEGNSVALTRSAARTRGTTDVFPFPEGEFKIASIESSYAAQRAGYLVEGVTDEKLYSFNDYSGLRVSAPVYEEGYANRLRDLLFAYFPNGKSHKNIDKVRLSGYTDDNAYRTTTGEKQPIVVCPIYKNDGGYKEVIKSDLYYYYFKEAEFNQMADNEKVAFLQNLPKYKLIPFKDHFVDDKDDVLAKTNAYACLYFGDGAPELGAVGTFQFPAGYRIGFMVRAMSDNKHGELYFDGRLNTKINTDKQYHFSSSGLKDGDPRATWFKMEDRVILCFESGTDGDFNDILLEVEGSVTDPQTVIEFEYNTYTYCFEDRQLGDYDLNDVVIKAKRLDKTHVQYALVACGAYDNLFVKNINAGVINDNTEIHSLFGKGTNQFINTESGAEYIEPIVVTKEVSESFSFLDEATQPYLYDKSTGLEVKLSKKGQDPHGIMLPYDFKYPLETVCIKDAYTTFNDWVEKNRDRGVLGTNWYTKPKNGKVYTK